MGLDLGPERKARGQTKDLHDEVAQRAKRLCIASTPKGTVHREGEEG